MKKLLVLLTLCLIVGCSSNNPVTIEDPVPYYLEISISGNEPAGSLIDVDYLALLEMEFYRTHFFDEWVFTFQDRSAILPYIYCDTVYDITNVSIHIWDSETPWNEIQCDFLVNGEPPEILQISSCNNYPISITAKW